MFSKNEISNYHLHGRNINSVRNMIKNLGKEISSLGNTDNTEINLVFSNHHYMFNLDEIKGTANYFDINLIPSFSVYTNEGIEVICLNPINNKSKSFIENLSNKREEWIYMILEELVNIDCPISIRDLLNRTNKEIHEVELEDICYEMANSEFYYEDCESIDSAYDNYIKPIVEEYPFKKENINKVYNVLNNDELIYNIPKYVDNLEDILINNKPDGFIINKETHNDLIKYAEINNIKLFPGTGEWI